MVRVMTRKGHMARIVTGKGHIVRVVTGKSHMASVVTGKGYMARVVTGKGHMACVRNNRQIITNLFRTRILCLCNPAGICTFHLYKSHVHRTSDIYRLQTESREN